MKLCCLDLDGVINYVRCKARAPSGCLGLEDDKLELLKQLIDETGAKILLTSTWKTDWYPTNHIEDLPIDGQYLVKKFEEHGLHIFAKTSDEVPWANRGKGILEFVTHYPVNIESYVILDDETFDYEFWGMDDKLVKTDFMDKGLTQKHVDKAVKILNG